MDWVTVGIQAGGAIGVCAMFLWYLRWQGAQQDESRKAFLKHLVRKDEQHIAAMQQQMEYLKQRDAQSKEIAMSGHSALRENTEAIQLFREEMRERLKEIKVT